MISLSVIIPCKNAENYISLCLDSLLRQDVNDSHFEIILVDNGSTDKTLEVLDNYVTKISLFVLQNGSISELRNYGAQESNGEWLAFIDADVEVDINWYGNLVTTIRELGRNGYDISKIITGSTYVILDTPTWIERIWFEQLLARDKVKNSYINAGNLIIHRSLFNAIGGFNPAYETGEDEKLYYDARIHGGRIVKNSLIRAIHHGYPKSIKHFFKRERWHGLAMKNYLARPWKYRDLLLALYYVIVMGMFLFALFFSGKVLISIIFMLLSLVIPLFLLATLRSKRKFCDVLPLTYLYFVYSWAKTFALFDIILKGRLRK